MKRHREAMINPKSEGRNLNAMRRPKSEFSPGLAMPESIRISGFGLLSAFEFRSSGLRQRGYLLTEALVYIGLIFLLLGIAYGALYRLIDNSVALRRNADDIIRSVHAGELWRADVRAATQGVGLENKPEEQIVRLESPQGEVDYRFAAGA